MKKKPHNNVPKIPQKTLEEFIQYSPQILVEVYEILENSNDTIAVDTFTILTHDEIYYHLQYHQKIILNFLHIQQIEILNSFFISSYRTFINKGIQSDFFPLLYNYIKNVCSKYLFHSDRVNIEKIYLYLETNHQYFLEASFKKAEIVLDEIVQKLYQYALDANFEKGVLLCESYCTDIDNLNNFFTTKIATMMDFVGYEWEVGEITFAIEHKITSYLNSLLDYFMTKLHTGKIQNSKTMLILNAPNEEHTLGVKLISNSFIKLGHTVLRLDNHTPIEHIIKVVEKVKPDFIAFSVTLVSNIYALRNIIDKLRKVLQINNFKIIVGGKAFEKIKNPTSTTKADLYFPNIDELAKYFKQLKT